MIVELDAVSATALVPYPALFFFAADDIDEVEREYKDWLKGDEDGFYGPYPDLTDRVSVVAAEVRYAIGYVWFIRGGYLETRPSWMVRAIPQ